MGVVVLFVYFMHSYNIVVSDVISEAIVVYCN